MRMIWSLFDSITPLKVDCGAYCGRACCQKEEDGSAGVLLFPGERELIEGKPWARIVHAEGVPILGRAELLFCDSPCERDFRPLGCRIFPLTPVLHNGTWKARMDHRARGLCFLADAGTRALSPEFVDAVCRAAEALSRDPLQRAFLHQWMEIEALHAPVDFLS